MLSAKRREILGLMISDMFKMGAKLRTIYGPRDGVKGYYLEGEEIVAYTVSREVGNRLINDCHVTISGTITEKGERAWHEWNQEQIR